MNDKICSVDGCEKKRHGKQEHCKQHYTQMKRHGRITHINSRRGRNPIKIHEDYAEIFVNDKYGNIISSTKISLESVELVQPYKVYSNGKDGYFGIFIDGKKYKLHRFLMGVHKQGREIEVDHIDRDRSNNQLCNLRLSNRSENCCNKIARKDNKTTNIKNITIHHGKYYVQIMKNGVFYRHLFDKLDDAIAWRNSMLDKLHKNFANKNIGE